MANPAQSLAVASGHTLVAQVTKDLGSSLGAAAVTEVEFTVPGALPEMVFLCVPQTAMDAGLAVGAAYSIAAGKVKVQIINPTAAPIDATSMVFTIIGL
jgi:hypothetical protein